MNRDELKTVALCIVIEVDSQKRELLQSGHDCES